MSTVLSYNADKFKILISDTRVTNYSNDSVFLDDFALKLHYIDAYGFLTGVGFGDLIKDTFNEIKKYKTINNSILQVSFRNAYNANLAKYGDKISDYIEKTAVVVSANDNVYLFSNLLRKLGFGNDSVTISKYQLNIQFPDNISGSKCEEIQSFKESLSAESTIDDVLGVMLKAFKKISSISDEVSGICSIAILDCENKSPFFYQKNADDIFEIITKDGFSGLNNEFEQYKTQLISWNYI